MFTDNSLTGSGNDSFDLWIFEAGGDVEATFVKISKDGAKWFDVGKIAGSTRGIDIDRYGYGPNDFFLYVRLTDDPDQGTPSGKDLPTLGADIDAVGAISSAPPVKQPRLSASPEVVKIDETITVTFSDVPEDLPGAVIIMVGVNSPDVYSPFSSFHLYGRTSGATTFTAEVPGEYNFRLLKETFVGPFGDIIPGERLAVSNAVKVVTGEDKRLTIPEVTGSPGHTVSVPINVNDAEGLAGLDITITYDSSALTFNEVEASSSFSGLEPVVNSSVTGKIILRIVGYDIPDGGSPFLNMSFTVNPNAVANTEASITIESIEAFDELGGDISITAQGGKVKIQSPYMKGDLDGDGKIRPNDAIILLRISAGLMAPTPQQLFAADFNNDGEIKSNDAILVLREAANSSSAP